MLLCRIAITTMSKQHNCTISITSEAHYILVKLVLIIIGCTTFEGNKVSLTHKLCHGRRSPNHPQNWMQTVDIDCGSRLDGLLSHDFYK